MRHTAEEIKAEFDKLSADEFIHWLTDQYLESIGGALNADNMDQLNLDQHSLLAYRYLLDEVMEGGYIQLIINGYAGYVIEGPFPIVLRKNWEMRDFAKHIFEVRTAYHQHHDVFEQDLSEEEFMALYEELEDLNELGDDFLDDFQETTTPAIANLVIKNIQNFI